MQNNHIEPTEQTVAPSPLPCPPLPFVHHWLCPDGYDTPNKLTKAYHEYKITNIGNVSRNTADIPIIKASCIRELYIVSLIKQ